MQKINEAPRSILFQRKRARKESFLCGVILARTYVPRCNYKFFTPQTNSPVLILHYWLASCTGAAPDRIKSSKRKKLRYAVTARLHSAALFSAQPWRFKSVHLLHTHANETDVGVCVCGAIHRYNKKRTKENSKTSENKNHFLCALLVGKCSSLEVPEAIQPRVGCVFFFVAFLLFPVTNKRNWSVRLAYESL